MFRKRCWHSVEEFLLSMGGSRYSACSPENFCDFFGKFSVFSVCLETTHKKSLKNSRKIQSISGTKIQVENSKNSGTFRSEPFLTGRSRQKGFTKKNGSKSSLLLRTKACSNQPRSRGKRCLLCPQSSQLNAAPL